MDYGIKELYSVALKTTFNMEINGVHYDKDEVLIRFDKILLASMNEDKSNNQARGGYNNATLITWDNTKDVQFHCEQGVISRVGLSILSNSKLFKKLEGENISVPIIGEEQDPENGFITLKYTPNGTGFIYDKESGEKLFSNLTERTYPAAAPIIADYSFDYTNGGEVLEVGDRLLNGYLKLEGKMRLKDDSDGHDKTAIVTIPRIKITSSLTMRLGQNTHPMVGNFSFIGYPVGMRGAQKVVDIQFLNDDIDSDF
jgi:hypothetical protein